MRIDKKIKVSCVVPIYNSGKYLRQFLESLVHQEFNLFEIICINDASTDNSLEILNDYKKGFKDFFIVNVKQNIGAGRARNLGIDMARGDYIIFFDSDDDIDRKLLSLVYNQCVDNDADMCIYYIDQFNDITQEKYVTNFEERNRTICTTYPVLRLPEQSNKLFQIINNSPCDKMFKTELLIKNQIKFQDLPNSNDIFYSYAAALSSQKIVFLDKVLYHVRLRSDGNITSIFRNKKIFIIEALDYIYDFMIDNNKTTEYYGSFYRKAIKDIYIYLFNSTEIIRSEMIKQLKTIYFNKWNMMDMIKGNMFNQTQLSILEKILEDTKLEDYMKVLCENNIEILKKQIDQWKKANLCVVLWGIGKYGKAFLTAIENSNIKLDYITDGSKEIQGQIVNDYLVSSCDFIKAQTNKIVLVANSTWVQSVRSEIGNDDRVIDLLLYLENC